MASNLGSLAMRPPTKSSARRAAAAGQCKDAMSRRLPNAAERHGGALVPDVRGEKTRFSARKRISMTDVKAPSATGPALFLLSDAE